MCCEFVASERSESVQKSSSRNSIDPREVGNVPCQFRLQHIHVLHNLLVGPLSRAQVFQEWQGLGTNQRQDGCQRRAHGHVFEGGKDDTDDFFLESSFGNVGKSGDDTEAGLEVSGDFGEEGKEPEAIADLVLGLRVGAAGLEDIHESGNQSLVCVCGFSNGDGSEDGANVLDGEVLDCRV